MSASQWLYENNYKLEAGTIHLKGTDSVGDKTAPVLVDSNIVCPNLHAEIADQCTGTAASANVALSLKTTTGVVWVDGAPAPTTGQILIATSPTIAVWGDNTVTGNLVARSIWSDKANALSTTGAAVNVSAAAPGTSGQVLTLTGATTATWQTPAAGGNTLVWVDAVATDPVYFTAVDSNVDGYQVIQTQGLLKANLSNSLVQITGALNVSGLVTGTVSQAQTSTWADTSNAISGNIVQFVNLGDEINGPAYNEWIGGTPTSLAGGVTSNGSAVIYSIEKAGGGDIVAYFSDGPVTIDSTPALTGLLTAGTDAVPVKNWGYITKAAPTVVTTSTVGYPTGEEFLPLGSAVCPTAGRVQTFGTYGLQMTTNRTWKDTTENGHVYYMGDWIRNQNASWKSGTALTPTLTAASPDTLTIAVATGTVLQFHTHTFPAFDSASGGTTNLNTFFVVNDNAAAYTAGSDLYSFRADDAGNATSNNDIICWVIWGTISEATGDCKIMVNLPSGFYSTSAAAIADSSKYANFNIPSDYRGVGFLIAKLSYQYKTTGGGDLVLVENLDLRGSFPNTAAGGSGISGASIELDNLNGTAVNASIIPGVDESIDLGTTLLKWENIYGNVTSEASTLGVATGTSLNFTGTLQGSAVTADATTNQLILGTTNTTTISSTAPSASRTVTLHDAGGNSNFVLNSSTALTITDTGSVGEVLTAIDGTTCSWQAAAGGSVSADSFTGTTTATAAGTTTLVSTDDTVQIFTGSSTQTVKFPVTTAKLGMTFTIANMSTGNVTVQDTSANAVDLLLTVSSGVYVCVGVAGAAADWKKTASG